MNHKPSTPRPPPRVQKKEEPQRLQDIGASRALFQLIPINLNLEVPQVESEDRIRIHIIPPREHPVRPLGKIIQTQDQEPPRFRESKLPNGGRR